MKRTILLLSFICITLIMQAQLVSGYEFKFKVRGLADTTLLIAHHYGSQQYVIDTIDVNSQGEAIYAGKDTLAGGIYLCAMPSLKNRYFEFIVSGYEQKFSLETDTVNFIKNMVVTGSKENRIFYQDLNFIDAKKIEITVLKDKLTAAGENTAEGLEIKETMKIVNTEVEQERAKLMEQNPDLFYASFLRAITDVKIPAAPLNPDGTKDSTFALKYIRQHYFDNINFADQRLLRTNMYDLRIKKYLKDYIQKTPDSIFVAVDIIINKTRVNKFTFQYVTVFLLNDFANSKLMGYDAVYVYLVDKYYSTGQAFWLDDVGLYRIQAQADKVRPTLLGKQAQSLILQDTANKNISLYDIDSRFTVILFWSPDCGHCKKEMPKFEKLYPELAALDVELLAVYSEEEFDKWKQWLREHPYPWINVADMNDKEPYQIKYNVDQTPVIFVLDKNKKIIGKRIGVDQIKDLILHHISIEDAG